jgi:valyl-tRNA synthetase
LRTKSEEEEKRLRENQSFIQSLALVKHFELGRDLEKPLHSAFGVVRDVEIFVPMERSQMEEEAKRLQKEILKIEKESVFIMRKLSNDQFLSKAPPEIVQEVKEKALEFRTQREKLEQSLGKIKEMIG